MFNGSWIEWLPSLQPAILVIGVGATLPIALVIRSIYTVLHRVQIAEAAQATLEKEIAERKRIEEALRLSEEKFAKAFRSSPDSITISTLTDGRFIEVNDSCLKLLGYSREEIIGKTSLELGIWAKREDRAKMRQLLEERGVILNLEAEFRASSGEVRVGLIAADIINFSSEQCILSVIRDITERKQAQEAFHRARVAETAQEILEKEIAERKRIEEALRLSEEKFAKAFRSSPDSITISTLIDGRFIEVNDSCLKLLGYSREEMIGRTAQELNIWANIENRTKMQEIFQEKGSILNFEAEFCKKSGESLVGLLSAEIIDFSGELCILAVIRDITERKRIEERLRYNAFHDTLTGLPNRSLFLDRLEHAIARSQRHSNYEFAVLLLDLDRFKRVNDSLGHLAGDHLLKKIASRLQECLRPGDTIARFGGDEFMVLLEKIEESKDVIEIAQRVRAELAWPFVLEGHEVFTTASIGIVLSSAEGDIAEDFLRNADIALYRAKSQSGAHYQIFDDAMHAQAVAHLQLEMALRRAIERQELRIYYQPIVSLTSGKITGFEALVRWQHPQRGLVSPAEFIPIAEETGLIIPMSQWILQTACQQTQKWQQQISTNSPLSISVNLSSKQFSQADLVEQIETVLQQTGLEASSLKLEITETVIIEYAESVANMLSQLKALNIQLELDDFGTGHSSLTYLHQFPVNGIKIDRSFVSHIGTDEGSSAIVKTIMMLSQNLHLNAIAEGIETPDQLAQIREFGCEYGQGYYFSKPVDTQTAEELLKNQAILGSDS